MKQFLTLVYKDFLILIRDKWGLGLLFAMPMALVLIMTAMQDTTFRSLHESGISLVLLNNDLDSLGNAIEKEICNSNYFDCHTRIDGRKPAVSEIREAVAGGKFQIGIIIPENTTSRIRERVRTTMENLFSGNNMNPAAADSIYITLYIDPAIRSSLRTSLQGKIREYSSKIETRIFLNELTVEINRQTIISVANLNLLQPQTVTCREEYVAFGNQTVIPNSVQHNIVCCNKGGKKAPPLSLANISQRGNNLAVNVEVNSLRLIGTHSVLRIVRRKAQHWKFVFKAFEPVGARSCMFFPFFPAGHQLGIFGKRE